MLASLLSRSTAARPTAAASSRLHSRHSTRTEVCPPSRQAEAAWWPRLQGWLRGDAPLAAPTPPDRLEPVRREFVDSLLDCLHDDPSHRAGAVLMRINTARSLRDLWHLRASLYDVIAVRHSQFEAEQRLAQLNRHFPTRSPRSGFVPLED